MTGSDEYAGLFGYIGSGGTVKNVKLENVQITSDNQYANVGGVAGYSRGNIENCSVSGSVSGNRNSDGTDNCVGGVVGQQFDGSITGCSSSTIVEGMGGVGGVAGKTANATLTACYATEDVTVERTPTNNTYAGGVVGSNFSSTLIACYATGSVTGTGTRHRHRNRPYLCRRRNGVQRFGHSDRLLPCYGDCQRPGQRHWRRNGSKL